MWVEASIVGLAMLAGKNLLARQDKPKNANFAKNLDTFLWFRYLLRFGCPRGQQGKA
jgi:hypothetical protein